MNMKDSDNCGRKDAKYSCILHSNTIINACVESAICNEKGYDEGNYRVRKCPRSECKKNDDVRDAVVAVKYNPVKLMGNIRGTTESSVNTSNEKSEGKKTSS